MKFSRNLQSIYSIKYILLYYKYYMKQYFPFLLIFWVAPLLSQNYYPCSCLLPEKFVPAVTSVEQIPVRSSLDAYSSNLLTMYYGQQKVTLLGLKDSTSVGDRKVYTLVSLEDGTQGWVEYAKIVPCGEGKVIAKNITAYKDNERSELSGYAFRSGEPVVATETVGDLIYVYSKNKTKKGWVSVYDIMSGKDEFQVAILLEKALQSKDAYSRKMALQQLQEKVAGNMQMYPIVQSEYWQVADATPPPPTPMPVPVPIYAANESRGLQEKKVQKAAPTTTPTQSSLTLVAAPQKQNKPAPSQTHIAQNRSITEKPVTSAKTTQERGITEKPAANKTVETPVKRDVAKPQANYQKNAEKYPLAKTAKIAPDKIFTCLHPKLPIGTKVRVPLLGNAGYVVMEVVGKSAMNAVEMSDASIKRIFGNQIPQKVEVQYFTTSK